MRKDDVKISIDLVLNQLPEKRIPGHTITLNGVEVPTDMDNLYLFKEKGIKCVGCQKVAQYFYIERFGNGKHLYNKWHLNLYGVAENGKDLLFTKDHIVPKIAGGLDDMDNMQTMCTRCNCKKGSRSMSDFSKNLIHAKEQNKKRENVIIDLKYKDRVKMRAKERYNLDINEDDYKKLLCLSLNGLILCDLTCKKSIRKIKYKNLDINVIYNSEYGILETLIESDYEKVKFDYLPAYMTKEFAEKEFKNVENWIEKFYNIKSTDKETALYFQSTEHPNLLFSMWKKKQHLNRLIWQIVKEKFNKKHKKQKICIA